MPSTHAPRTIHPRLQTFVQLAAVVGIAAFLSFPVAPHAPDGANVARWVGDLIGYVR